MKSESETKSPRFLQISVWLLQAHRLRRTWWLLVHSKVTLIRWLWLDEISHYLYIHWSNTIISPYFDGRIKMNSPYPEITNISFLAKLFFKTFISLKHLSNCRTVGLSDCRTIGLSDYQTVGLSDCRIIATAPFRVFDNNNVVYV
jgi:hypothetical protein